MSSSLSEGFVCAFIAAPESGVCFAALAYEIDAVIPTDSSKTSNNMRIEFLFMTFSFRVHAIPQTACPATPVTVLFLLGCAVAGFLRVGFRHIFTLLGLPVPARSRLVIDAGVGVHPDHPGAVRGRSLLRRRSRGLRSRLRRSGGRPARRRRRVRWSWCRGRRRCRCRRRLSWGAS